MSEDSVKEGTGVPSGTESVKGTDDSHKSQAKHRIQPKIKPNRAEGHDQVCDGAEEVSTARPRATGCAMHRPDYTGQKVGKSNCLPTQPHP